MNKIILFLSQRILAIVFILLAIIGSITLYSYIKDLKAKIPDHTGFSEIILARQDIAVGQEITEDLLTKQPISQNIISDKFIYNKEIIIGKTAKEDMTAGELISIDKIDDLLLEINQDISFSSYIPLDLRAVSIPVCYYGDSNYLKNGDRIDLISVFNDNETNSLISQTILENKEIIMTASTGTPVSESLSFLDSTIGDLSVRSNHADLQIITMYLEPEEIETVFLALGKGTLNISICSPLGREGLVKP
jgi:Flp pilus assembly protein CpaB